MLRRPTAGRLTQLAPVLQSQFRFSKIVVRQNVDGNPVYASDKKMINGQDIQLKMTEFYDGYTEDYGSFKEGPPATLRLEYLRQPEHATVQDVNVRHLWSPFEASNNLKLYSRLFYDQMGCASRDYFGHRHGHHPDQKAAVGHYKKGEWRLWDERYLHHNRPFRRVPKWLAVVINDKLSKKFLGFYLYANGAYVVEGLTYKQLPRLSYNRPFQGFMPTLGQAVDLAEVTYGKEVHSLEFYAGYGACCAMNNGTSCTILRGTEPNLVPIMTPSKEIRLVDTVAQAVFGRRAGVLQHKRRLNSPPLLRAYDPKRPRSKQTKKRVNTQEHAGGRSHKRGFKFQLDFMGHPRHLDKRSYWASGYVLRNRQHTTFDSVGDIKARTYSWASRPTQLK